MENTQETKKPWGRKQKVNLYAQLFLLAGLIIGAWMKIDFQLYLCYAAGVTGANLGFIWGNSKEYQYASKSTES